ncbi:DUF4189 domain-containing protein [Xanthomonas euvesicatoria pv. allii]|uniref:DUF4189 domain-containing protein n=1 Tax=Xanthomonas euvesicatoria TaxID=456327 RepID=UPI002406C55A|nr:DUF4189 domain-containing protein [Xanthomonas euvesicatoria]MCP3046287.1 DUF4189 domain-containing protein [Xanthomonas euvesicatoria pv. allii]
MKLILLSIFITLLTAGAAQAEQGCPPGQYPIGGQGVASCAPIPQNSSRPEGPSPTGTWIKSWGAIAMGSNGSTTNYGVNTGKFSKSDAEKDALEKCASHGQSNCKIFLTYRDQCSAIVEPYVNGTLLTTGIVSFTKASTTEKAKNRAQRDCREKNKNAPETECKTIYTACSEPVYKEVGLWRMFLIGR